MCPGFYPNDLKTIPICDMFGAKCFDMIMSDETYYRNCTGFCLEDCKGTSYLGFPSLVPIDSAWICRQPLFRWVVLI